MGKVVPGAQAHDSGDLAVYDRDVQGGEGHHGPRGNIFSGSVVFW